MLRKSWQFPLHFYGRSYQADKILSECYNRLYKDIYVVSNLRFFLHSYFCTLYIDTQNTLHSSYIEYSVVWNITKCITLYCYFIQIYLKYPCFQQIDTATLKSQMADFFKAALDYDVYRYNIKFFWTPVYKSILCIFMLITVVLYLYIYIFICTIDLYNDPHVTLDVQIFQRRLYNCFSLFPRPVHSFKE